MGKHLRRPESILLLFLIPPLFGQSLLNGNFEASRTVTNWTIAPKLKGNGSVVIDTAVFKEGHQSVLVSAARPTHITLEQEVFLPIGGLWRLSAWTKSALTTNSSAAPAIEIDSPVGSQGKTEARVGTGWQQPDLLFRVPSPGRLTIRLIALSNAAGKVWMDDVRLIPVPEETGTTERVRISRERLSRRPIDLKQGGQFVEPLCNLLTSMAAQQVASTSFEEEPPFKFEYKRAVDKPYRPWYPDGAVHDARYSLDAQNPFNGKLSEKIELPLGNMWAGISQDGFYTDAGHAYRLKLHLRSKGTVQVRARLHGAGKTIGEPVSLGEGSADWRPASATFQAGVSSRNATLTIEFSGPGTLWLDRIYLIDEQAVLGIWRTDVVAALNAMHPGIVRFGGTSIQSWDWDKCIGDWDTRVPYVTDGWGGLDPNFIGLEEFVQLCRYVNAEPLICGRWKGKRPEDAAAEVEYMNGSPDTKWGSIRARNGHREPYAVKYWQIGNEIDGPEYLHSLNAFATAMKRADPSIKLMSSFPQPKMLESAGGQLDYLCPHDYSVGNLAGNEKEFQDLAAQIAREADSKDVHVAVTEWNTTGGEEGLHRGMLLTLGNALSCSRYQNLLHRYADLVEIANRSNLSDSFGSGVLQPEFGLFYLTPTYFSQQLYQRAAGSFPLRIARSSNLASHLQEPDLSATISEDGSILRLFSVNSTPADRPIKLDLDSSLGTPKNAQSFVLMDTSSPAESEAMNSRDEPGRIAVRQQRLELGGREIPLRFAPFSVTLVELTLRRP